MLQLMPFPQHTLWHLQWALRLGTVHAFALAAQLSHTSGSRSASTMAARALASGALQCRAYSSRRTAMGICARMQPSAGGQPAAACSSRPAAAHRWRLCRGRQAGVLSVVLPQLGSGADVDHPAAAGVPHVL